MGRKISYATLVNKYNVVGNVKDVKKVNGEIVVNYGFSSEHSEYKDKWCNYVCFTTDIGNDYYYPILVGRSVPGETYLVHDENVWNFIKEQGLPTLEF